MNEIVFSHPSAPAYAALRRGRQSTPLAGERRKACPRNRIANEWSGSPLLFARGEGDGEELLEENWQFPDKSAAGLATTTASCEHEECTQLSSIDQSVSW
jgi:hypothetical protein